MHGILIMGLPGDWGGNQGTVHSSGHFAWRMGRPENLPGAGYPGGGLCRTSLGDTSSPA